MRFESIAVRKAKGEDLGEREGVLLGKASQIEEEVAA